jgi:hypothetical protein
MVNNMDFYIEPSDILLVERNGTLYRCPIENLNYRYLTIGDNDILTDLEEKIAEVSAYIVELSTTINSEERDFTSISALNEMFELRWDADQIKNNPLIIDEDKINKIVRENNIAKKEQVDDDWFERDIERTNNLMDGVMNDAMNWMN